MINSCITYAEDITMELFDICDNNGNPTGAVTKREDAHKYGIPHRTAHVWITRKYDGKDQILLQKRSSNKDSFPGMYDTSSAGHIPAGDEPRESALRELKEELGIDAEPAQLKYAGSFHAKYELIFHGGLFKDNEYVFVYVYDGSVEIKDLHIQEEELEAVEWFDLEEVYQEISRKQRDRFCVPTQGLEILRKYLRDSSH